MEQVIHFLQKQMEKPAIFSWFHLFAFISIAAVTFLLSFFFHDAKEKTYKRILFIFWISLLVLEVIKQILRSFHYGSPSYWEFSSGDFPFHICSMLYYLIPIILFVNKEKHPKIIDAIVGYLSFVSLFSGLAVCIYTDMVMSSLMFTNVQSLVHHGSQVALGVFIFVWNRKDVTIKTTYRSLIAFGITAVIAIIINVIIHPLYINMFFINPLRLTNLPIFYIIQEKAGFFVYLIVYLIGIVLITYLIYFIEISIYKLTLKRKEKKQNFERS